MIKKILEAVAVVFLAGIGAGGVLYIDAHCPKKNTAMTKKIEQTVSSYIQNNSQDVLETLSKNEKFGDIVKNFSNISDEELLVKIKSYIENNPSVMENYIRNNASFVAETVLNTDSFKAVSGKNNQTEEETEKNEAQENPDKKFLDHWDEMRNSEIAPFTGPKDAKVAVVEFFDFACGHCKALAPVLARLVKENPDVKFVFNPLFFLSEYSPYAAKAAMAAYEKGKFLEVYEGIMTLPELNENAVNQILEDEGLNTDEIKKMSEEKKIRRGIQDIDALSQLLGVNGVPVLIINGEPFSGRSFEDLQNKLNSYK